jgi:predicted nucleic acid-binding protein
MPRYFFDSSALVKRYHAESGSDKVEQLFADASRRILISRLALVEFHSCFARLVRERVISEAQFLRLLERLKSDARNNTFSVAALSGPRLLDASALLATHGLTNSIRALDAIHLATALALHRRSGLGGFVTADKRLLTSATACGLTPIDVG